jgi:hypothetical protein
MQAARNAFPTLLDRADRPHPATERAQSHPQLLQLRTRHAAERRAEPPERLGIHDLPSIQKLRESLARTIQISEQNRNNTIFRHGLKS